MLIVVYGCCNKCSVVFYLYVMLICYRLWFFLNLVNIGNILIMKIKDNYKIIYYFYSWYLIEKGIKMNSNYLFLVFLLDL